MGIMGRQHGHPTGNEGEVLVHPSLAHPYLTPSLLREGSPPFQSPHKCLCAQSISLCAQGAAGLELSPMVGRS